MPIRCYRSILLALTCRESEYDAVDGSSEARLDVLALTRANFPALLLSQGHSQLTNSHAVSHIKRNTDARITPGIATTVMVH